MKDWQSLTKYGYGERNISSFLGCDSRKTESLKKLCSDYIIVRSSVKSQRQYNQSGCFILFPNRIIENNDFALQIDEIPGKIHEKIVVDKNSKKDMLQTLRLLGITKGYIYPDRTDYVGADVLKMINYHNA